MIVMSATIRVYIEKTWQVKENISIILITKFNFNNG